MIKKKLYYTVTCPTCSQELETEKGMMGKDIKCPSCNKIFHIHLFNYHKKPPRGLPYIIRNQIIQCSDPGGKMKTQCPFCCKKFDINQSQENAAVQCPTCKREFIALFKKCQACGKKNFEDDVFCQNCNNVLDKKKAKEINKEYSPWNNIKFKDIVPLLILVGIIAFFVFLFSWTSNSPKTPLKFKKSDDMENEIVKSTIKTNWVVEDIYLIRSKSHKNAWYFGAKAQNDSTKEIKYCVWCKSGYPWKPGLIFSVNQDAFEVSGMGMLRNSKAAVPGGDRESRELEKFIGGNNE